MLMAGSEYRGTSLIRKRPQEEGGVEGDAATQEDILGRIQGVDDSLALLEGEVRVVDNLLVRVHFIVVMVRWAGLAPWEFE